MSALVPERVEMDFAPTPLLAKSANVVVTLCILAVTAMALVLFYFAMPVWDDLTRATRPTEIGYWRYVIGFVYNHWQGRWASAGLEAFILPRADITRFYFVLIGAVAAIDALAVYLVCRWFTPDAPRRLSAALSAGLLAMLWAGMPSLGESVYWFTGAVENMMVLALAAMVLIALLRMDGRHHAIYIAVLCVSAVVICGFHELYGAMFCIALIAGSIAAWMKPNTNKIAWTAVAISALVGVVIVAVAPGNSARLTAESGSHGKHFIYDLIFAIKEFGFNAVFWLIDPKLIAVTVFLLVSPTLNARRLNAMQWRWLMPPVWVAMVGLGFFAPSWAFGTYMPLRTLSGNYVVFVMGWLLSVFTWSLPTRTLLQKLMPRSNMLVSITLLVFAISLVTIGNFTTTRRDLRDRLHPWRAAVQARYAYLRKARGSDALVTVLPKPPWVLLNGEVVDDPTDYRNWSTVDFFHLRSIRIQPTDGSPPVAPPPVPTRPPAEKIGF